MESEKQDAFAVWITGLPASGKSTVAAALWRELAQRGITAAVLESDEMRRILTPHPTYDEAGRDAFYNQVASLGALLARQGVPVIFDATAHVSRARAAADFTLPGSIRRLSAAGLHRAGSEGHLSRRANG